MTTVTTPTRLTGVDLFAGFGGFTLAAERAGIEVLAAYNHHRPAVDCHAANHPDTIHGCYRLDSDFDYSTMPACDILIASPSCQGHSRLRGKDDPRRHDAARATALAVVAATHSIRPKAIVVENVPEFREWGRDRDGSRYRWWLSAFTTEGYRVKEHVIDAADWGVPSHRTRLYITMVHESLGVAPPVILNPHRPHVPASEIIDRGPTFEHKLTPIADKCLRTRTRVAAWKAKLGLDEWVFRYLGDRGYGFPLTDTLSAMTCNDCLSYVKGDKMRSLDPTEMAKAMGFPAEYKLPRTRKEKVKAIGNAVAVPVAEAVLRAVADAVKAGMNRPAERMAA